MSDDQSPSTRLEQIELRSGHATLVIFGGIVLDIVAEFVKSGSVSHIVIAILANALIGIGLVAEYFLILKSISVNRLLQRQSEEQVAMAMNSAAEADKAAAEARERAIRLEIMLESQRLREMPRRLTEIQKTTLIEHLKGKLAGVILCCHDGMEPFQYATQWSIVLRTAELKHVGIAKMSSGEFAHFPAGVMMYAPGGAKSEDDLVNDHLYRALKAANLFGGMTVEPRSSFGLLSFNSADLLAKNEHIIYIGRKDA